MLVVMGFVIMDEKCWGNVDQNCWLHGHEVLRFDYKVTDISAGQLSISATCQWFVVCPSLTTLWLLTSPVAFMKTHEWNHPVGNDPNVYQIRAVVTSTTRASHQHRVDVL